MRRVLVSILVVLPLAAVGACLSFGDLTGGSDAGSTPEDASLDTTIAETSVADVVVIVDSGPVDQGDAGILSCNAPGLVAYFPMNEGVGSITQDCHQGIDGTLTSYGEGGVTWGARGDSGSLEFTRDGYVMLGIRPQFQLTGAFTISGWIRSDSIPPNYVALFYNFAFPTLTGFELDLDPDGGSYAQIGYGTTNATARFPQVPVAAPFPPLHAWTHLAAVYTPGVGLEVYANGVSVGAATNTGSSGDGGPIPDSGAAPNVGRQSLIGAIFYNSNWTGGVDEVRLFSRALNDTEIKTLAAQ